MYVCKIFYRLQTGGEYKHTNKQKPRVLSSHVSYIFDIQLTDVLGYGVNDKNIC